MILRFFGKNKSQFVGRVTVVWSFYRGKGSQKGFWKGLSKALGFHNVGIPWCWNPMVRPRIFSGNLFREPFWESFPGTYSIIGMINWLIIIMIIEQSSRYKPYPNIKRVPDHVFWKILIARFAACLARELP